MRIRIPSYSMYTPLASGVGSRLAGEGQYRRREARPLKHINA